MSAAVGTEVVSALRLHQLNDDVPLDVGRAFVAAVEAEPQDGMGDGPVPAGVDVEALEQLPAPLEQRFHRVERKAPAEPAGPGEEIMPPALDRPPHVVRPVDVVAAVLTDGAELLDPDRKPKACHRSLRSRPRYT